jgi:hypothetical protein
LCSLNIFHNENENKERAVTLTIMNGESFLPLKREAIAWLQIIDNEKKGQEKWNELFGSEANNKWNSFEIIDDEIDTTSELTPKEIENVRIFLNAFNDLVQLSKTLPEETKNAYSKAKTDAEEKLDNRPTKSFYKWFIKLWDSLSVRYLTDQKYRDEMNGYIRIAVEKAKHFGQLALDWIKQIGDGHPH